jgi:hypothetical protein
VEVIDEIGGEQGHQADVPGKKTEGARKKGK